MNWMVSFLRRNQFGFPRPPTSTGLNQPSWTQRRTHGNLEDILLVQEDLPGAEAHFQQAIAICEDIYPLAVGVFGGTLALLRAWQGAFDEARALLADSEPHVRSYLLEHGMLLTKKVRVELLAGDPDAAEEALAEAESIASETSAHPESDLSQTIAEAPEHLSPGTE